MVYTKTQRIILALGTAGVAATGAVFGAQLKTDGEKPKPVVAPVAQQTQAAQAGDQAAKPKPAPVIDAIEAQALTAQRIHALETQRAQLLGQRMDVVRKLEALGERMRENEKKEARREAARGILEKEKEKK